jgi:RNA polymerase sigma factor (sigma-70 family)
MLASLSYQRKRSTVLTHEETAHLVRRAQRGEPEAFAALVRGYLRATYAVALAIVSRPADAEDIAQDTFMKAFEHIDSCREPERFAGWLLQIARNQARNHLDRRRLRDVTADGAAIVELASAASGAAGMRQALLDGLALLDERHREVVLLHDLENWTHPEIAVTLGVSEVMSRQILWKARQTLRAKLGGGLPSEDDHAG